MSGNSSRDPFEIIDDPQEYIAQRRARLDADAAAEQSSTQQTRGSIGSPSQASTSADPSSSSTQHRRVLPRSFNASSSSTSQSNGTIKGNSSSASVSSASRVWNPPPRPWEKEIRDKAASSLAAISQPDAMIPTVGGSGARVPNRFLDTRGDFDNKDKESPAIDLTEDGSSDDEPTLVSVKEGEVTFDEEKNNGAVCLGQISAMALCMYGLPAPAKSNSPATADPALDTDPMWSRENWPGASRWWCQPGYRPVDVRLKYPPPGTSQAQQRTAGQWSHGGRINSQQQQSSQAELAVSIVLSPRANLNRQMQEGIPQSQWSARPHSMRAFGALSDKFTKAFEQLMNSSMISMESRCRMVPESRATGFIHTIELLLFCTRPNVAFVSERLASAGILLEAPAPGHFSSSDYPSSPPLINPHHNAHAAVAQRAGRFNSALFYGGAASRGVSSREMNEEDRKRQIESVYDQLIAGENLAQAEISPLIVTNLFPHQRQAVTFLLDREKRRSFDEDRPAVCGKSSENYVGLWQVLKASNGQIRSYRNMVTGREQSKRPSLCRSAILADDMGLGKTITVIATIAATIDEAATFGKGKLHRLALAKGSKNGTAEADSDSGEKDDDGDSALSDMVSGLQRGKRKLKVANGGPAKKVSKREAQRKDAERARLANLTVKSRATLLVCPLSIVANWEEQIKEHWDPIRLPSIYIYHGSSRSMNPELIADHDIVMTTYATLAAEFANQRTWEVPDAAATSESDSDSDSFDMVDEEGHLLGPDGKKKKGKKRKRKIIKESFNPLQRIEWFRIVLDEAHTIKEARTMQCRAVCNLTGERRLSLTGTPVQNRLDDLFAQVRFLRLEPFADRAVWNEHCAQKKQSGRSTNNEPLEQVALVKVQTIMKFLTLRRTKETKKADGRKLLELPAKNSRIVTIDFADERTHVKYEKLRARYMKEFKEMQQEESVGANYATILQEILNLRLCCDHPGLVDTSKDLRRIREGKTDLSTAIREDGLTRERAAGLFQIFSESSMAECSSCGMDLSRFSEDGPATEEGEEAKVRPVVTKCNHVFCSTCFAKAVGSSRWKRLKSLSAEEEVECPACNISLSIIMDAIQLETLDILAFQNEAADEDGERPSKVEDNFDWGSDDEKDEHSLKRTRYAKRGAVDAFGADAPIPIEERHDLSSKIRYLLGDLIPNSACNNRSVLYDASSPQLTHVTATPEDLKEGRASESVCLAESFEDPDAYQPIKSVIFSQWTTMLDRIGRALHRAGIRYVRLDGKMKRPERAAALETFKRDNSVEVFLISLRAGGFGLNLTSACRAYCVEPAWNPAVEQQALDRIHRLGQTRPVVVTKLITRGTIEENMLTVQKRKQELANAVGATRTKAEEKKDRHTELSILLGGGGGSGGSSGGMSTSNTSVDGRRSGPEQDQD